MLVAILGTVRREKHSPLLSARSSTVVNLRIVDTIPATVKSTTLVFHRIHKIHKTTAFRRTCSVYSLHHDPRK